VALGNRGSWLRCPETPKKNVIKWTPSKRWGQIQEMREVRPKAINRDYIRTNVMADYLDKMSTNVYHYSDIEEDETEAWIQLAVIIGILIYMFICPGDKDEMGLS